MTKEEIKTAVRKRDGMKCKKCGMTNEEHKEKYRNRSLHVHRKQSDGPYSLENCETLCYVCHGLERVGKKPTGKGYRGKKPILLGLTPEQYEMISAAAKLDNRSITQFIINAGLEECREIREKFQNNS